MRAQALNLGQERFQRCALPARGEVEGLFLQPLLQAQDLAQAVVPAGAQARDVGVDRRVRPALVVDALRVARVLRVQQRAEPAPRRISSAAQRQPRDKTCSRRMVPRVASKTRAPPSSTIGARRGAPASTSSAVQDRPVATVTAIPSS